MHTYGSDDEMDERPGGTVIVGRLWDAVGPFPSGMREHPFLATPLHAFPSQTFPNDPDVDFARRPYDGKETWMSELGEGGRVGWKRFKANDDGWLEVSYSDIRWDQLRADHGWASLQYQVLLRTTIEIPLEAENPVTPILIDVIQGTEYAFIPIHSPPEVPTRWYNGDVYNFASTPSGKQASGNTSTLARTVSLRPGMYTLLVRANYEVRLFGDPKSADKPNRGPVIRMKVQAEVAGRSAVSLSGNAVVPDAMDGWLMGDWLSLPIRAGPADVRVISCSLHPIGGLALDLVGNPCLSAGQTRSIAMRVRQTAPIKFETINCLVRLQVEEDGKRHSLSWIIPIFHRNSQLPGGRCRITFASPSSSLSGSPASVSYATIIIHRPISDAESNLSLPPVILALHGAGVDAGNAEWMSVIPERDGGWAVLPTGRNEWGEDWHGGSMADAWAARDVLPVLAAKLGYLVSEKTLLIGHSNGGQGAWHSAARYPDRIVGLIAAAGWLTIHDYVPYTEQISNHFADPSLMGILRSSLTPYDNDLHASNLVGIPILAIHGADDDNVAPRHSRAHLAAVAAWAGSEENLTYLEVPKRGHYWGDIFKQPKVIAWMDQMSHKRSPEFKTLSCANPLECGGRDGTRILELETPGRLARMSRRGLSPPYVEGMSNVRKFAYKSGGNNYSATLREDHWDVEQVDVPELPSRAYGPMIRLLATDAVITLVHGATPHLKHLALRLAHDLLVYHRIDCEVIDDKEGRDRLAEGRIAGSLICLGRPEDNEVVDWMVGQARIPVSFPLADALAVDGKMIRGDGTGVIALHPHPCRTLGLAAIIAGNDDLGTELAARLFPIRTGVMVPDWAVVSPEMQWKGAGGLHGAGFFGHDWQYNSTMSWLHSSFPTAAGGTSAYKKRWAAKRKLGE